MKILVIGDTHNRLSKVRDIWQKLNNIDLVIHTGDYYTDAKALQEELRVPFVYVKGNCDGSYSGRNCDPAGGDFAIVETEYGKILVTHGHNEHVNYSYDNLLYKAAENGCIAAVFGHTHQGLVNELPAPFGAGGSKSDSIWLVNPGSLTQPRDGSGGSYAVIRTDEDSFTANVVYYNTVMGGSGNKKSGKTGYVSSLLSYSDRF